MKQIKLSQEQFALVDDEDFEWLNKFKWYACKKNCERNIVKRYARRYESINGKRVCVYMHREIMKTPPDMVTDHAPDTSGLNNQKENLTNVYEEQNTKHCRFVKRKKQYESPSL